MKIASITNDRKKLVKALEEATGLTAKYLYAPSFAYEIGPYTVDRAGIITVEDSEASAEVLAFLEARDLIKQDTETSEDATATIISLPLEGHTGRSLKNLVFMLHSKSVLLGKAVGWPGLYRVSEKMISALEQKTPGDTEEFLKMLEGAGEDAIKGLSFEEGKIGFFFPYTTDPDRLHAYMQLTTLMAKTAKEQNRVQPDKSKVTNEKYTFRVWLMRLGMLGDEYKLPRRILMQNLKGNAAFRTMDQKEAALERLRVKRAAEKEAASELAFEEL